MFCNGARCSGRAAYIALNFQFNVRLKVAIKHAHSAAF